MPELLNHLPVFYLTTANNVPDLVSLLMGVGFITNVEIEFWIDKLISTLFLLLK